MIVKPRAASLAQLASTAAMSASLQLSCERLPCQPYEIEWTIEDSSGSKIYTPEGYKSKGGADDSYTFCDLSSRTFAPTAEKTMGPTMKPTKAKTDDKGDDTTAEDDDEICPGSCDYNPWFGFTVTGTCDELDEGN